MQDTQDINPQPQAEQIIDLFNQLFVPTYKTCLVGGGEEPIYLPATGTEVLHRIIFTRDYFSSALHEIAHWCVAGTERHQLVDFGYWYAPDGRSLQQQHAFERVEVKPQALEWIFATACAVPFRVSADNLAQGLGASAEFKDAIAAQVVNYLQQGLPPRPRAFALALGRFYQTAHFLQATSYSRSLLD